MLDAQASANLEEKSSAGDKYETGRAMSQLERDRNATHLLGAQQMLRELMQFETHHTTRTDVVRPGSLVLCGNEIYFLAAGIGRIMADNRPVFVLSLKSPLASLLLTRETGYEFSYNGKKFKITAIY